MKKIFAGWFAVSILFGWSNHLMAEVATDALLRPSDVTNISLAPSGKRLAALVKGKSNQEDFVVFDRTDQGLNAVLSTRLPANQSIEDYQWVSDDYLAVRFLRASDNVDVFAIASVPKHTITLLDPSSRVVRGRWEDDHHVLLSTTKDCLVQATERIGTCLVSYDLLTSGSKGITFPVYLFPANFVVNSATEIYARGRDANGQEQAFSLDANARSWQAISLAEFQQKAAVQNRTLDLSPEAKQRVRGVRSGNKVTWNPVLTQPSERVVGMRMAPPARGFTALDAALDPLEVLLETKFAGKRAELEQVTDDLSYGLVSVTSPDDPQQYYLWDQSRGLVDLQAFRPKLDGSKLVTSRVVDGWPVSGYKVTITPAVTNSASAAVVVLPALAQGQNSEEQLNQFSGMAHVLSQRGITVVRLALELPNQFASGNAANAWRDQAIARIKAVAQQASAELAGGKPVCLMGDYWLAALATAAATDNNSVGCVADIDLPTRPEMLTTRIKLDNLTIVLATQTLRREFVAAFGDEDAYHHANDPVAWAPHLPAKVMLAYRMTENVPAAMARNSGEFRSAAKKAGKDITYYVSTSDREDKLAYDSRMLDAVGNFIAQSAIHP